MSQIILFPSLTEQGWLNNSSSIADMLFSHFMLSDYSQTYVYDGHVSSLAWIIEQTQGNSSKLVSLINRHLSEYFGHYFSDVNVESSVTDDPTNPSKQDLKVWLSYTGYDDLVYSLSRTLELVNGVSRDVISLNNDGVIHPK